MNRLVTWLLLLTALLLASCGLFKGDEAQRIEDARVALQVMRAACAFYAIDKEPKPFPEADELCPVLLGEAKQ